MTRRKSLTYFFPIVVPLLAIAAPIAVNAAGQTARAPEAIFATRCAYCHDSEGWGTRALSRRLPQGQAELLNRPNLPPDYTIFVVRRGIGAMPQFTPSELTDEELRALANWLEDPN
jgi:mono/diheme cytochrome c family protein